VLESIYPQLEMCLKRVKLPCNGLKSVVCDLIKKIFAVLGK